MQTITLRSIPDYTLEVTLEEVVYQFRIRWIERAAQWSLDILDRAGVLLLGGLAMVLDSELLRSHTGRGLPPGVLVLIDPSGRTHAVTFDDLEERCALIYLTEAEYAAV